MTDNSMKKEEDQVIEDEEDALEDNGVSNEDVAVYNDERDSKENEIEQVDDVKSDSENEELSESPEEEKLGESEGELLERQVRDFHRNQIEAALYASGSSLTIEELSTKLEISKKEVEELVNELAFDYLDRSTALVIAQLGDDRFQMQIKPEYTEKVSKFAKGGAIAEKYLRTLTIIALKQPILKSMVIKLRGSGAYEHVKYLMDNDFITGVKKGRSAELTTTDKYSEMFGLPKDKQQMKRIMIAQLGIEEDKEKVNNQ